MSARLTAQLGLMMAEPVTIKPVNCKNNQWLRGRP
jgi:hypothetical protein